MERIVTIPDGRIEGLPAADPRITSFKGIPFAAPPVGQNRWRAPMPVKSWEGTLKAYQFAPISKQTPPGKHKDIYAMEWSVDPSIPNSEDSLYLNIWTPNLDKNANLPVFIWFFGGGLQVGSPAEMEFDGERLARRGIVVVTASYRLNVFGFLAHPQLALEQPDAPTNFGHLDQRQAILWVRDNIRSFGGNPKCITIGGQSAGGGSVMSQLTSPMNKGLFQRAIVDSGVFHSIYEGHPTIMRGDYDGAMKRGEELFAALGVKTLEEARQLDADIILNKVNEMHTFWGTNFDGVFQIRDAADSFMMGERLEIPVLMGNTHDEFHITVPADKFPGGREALAAAKKACTSSNTEMLFSDKEPDMEGADINSVEFACRLMAESNACREGSAPLFYYDFNLDIPGWDHPGNFHSSDLWFWFETLQKCWRPFVGRHYDAARIMCDYWANFIKNGDPNGIDGSGIISDDKGTISDYAGTQFAADGPALPQWDAYTKEAPYGLRIAPDSIGMFRKEADPVMKALVNHMKKQVLG